MDYIFSKSKPEVGDKGFIVGDRFVKNFEISLKSITVNEGAYINTGIYIDKSNLDYCIEMKVGSDYSFVSGFRYEEVANNSWILFSFTNRGTGNPNVYSGNFNTRKIIERSKFENLLQETDIIKYDMKSGFYLNDNQLVSFSSISSFNNSLTVPLPIFADWDFHENKIASTSVGKCYYVKISRSGNLIMDLIPYKKESRYGMLDTLTGNFFASAGEVEFSK